MPEKINARNVVCHITTAHKARDVRIFHKEAKSLAAAKFDVIIIAQNDRDEVIEGIKIVALPKPQTRFQRMAGLSFRALILALRQKADVYHFHDPELVPAGLLLKLFRRKVIYDVHEDYPLVIQNRDWLGSDAARKIAAGLFNLLEQFSSRFFDCIIPATLDIARKFPKSKTIVLKNFPLLALQEEGGSGVVEAEKEKPVIIYAGELTRIRGIRELTLAMEFIRDKAELWLLGDWETESFEKECRRLDGWKYSKYLGFFPLEKVYGYTKLSDIGISILHPRENYITSLPVKAFEYMACSLPIVMSDFPYWQEIFGECALFADPCNPEEIAEKISFLLDNPEIAEKLGKKGKELVETKYNWEIESRSLVNLYEKLLHGR